MKYKISEKTYSELLKELALYPQLREMVKFSREAPETKRQMMYKLAEEELRTNIALLYCGSKTGQMEDMLSFMENTPMKGEYRANFGNGSSRIACVAILKETLSSLDQKLILSSRRLSFFHRDIAEYMDLNPSEIRNGRILYDYDFWVLYFELYDEYIKAEEKYKI